MTLVDPSNNNNVAASATQLAQQQEQETMNGMYTQLRGVRDTLTQMNEESRRVMTMHVPSTWENIQEFFLNALRYLRIIR